jgi:hypothetical protein
MQRRNELLDNALKYNQRIWSISRWKYPKPENPLPDAVKKIFFF